MQIVQYGWSTDIQGIKNQLTDWRGMQGLISRGLITHSRRFGLYPEDSGEPMNIFSTFTF